MDKITALYNCHTKSTVETCNFTWVIENFSMLLFSLNHEPLKSTMFSLNQNISFELVLSITDDMENVFLHLYPKLENLQSINLTHYCLFLDKTGTLPSKIYKSRSFFSNNKDIGRFYSGGIRSFSELSSKCLSDDDCLKIFCSVSALMNVSSIQDETSKDAGELMEKDYINIPPYIDQLFKKKEFADFTFVIDDQELKAHKCVLAAASPVFQSMLQNSNWKENVENKMEITDISVEVFEQLLHYIYLGNLTDLDKIAPELIYLAEKYDMPRLKTLCSKKLCEQIKKENAWRILEIADDCLAIDLKKDAMDFILANRTHMIKRDEYQNIVSKKLNLIADIFNS